MFKYLFFFLFFLCVLSQDTQDPSWNNVVVRREISLKEYTVIYAINITAKNEGSNPLGSYFITFHDTEAQHLSSIRVLSEGKKLEVSKTDSGYETHLSTPVAVDAEVKLRVRLSFSHILTPFPAEVTQDEVQLVKYSGNHYFFSPYPTSEMKTVVKLAGHVKSFSKLKPFKTKKSALRFGAYKNLKKESFSSLDIHFECNKPFMVIKDAKRLIEVSHWGNIAVEEKYHVVNAAAKLKGGFQRANLNSTASRPLLSFTQKLPKGAADVYYRDDIGNISTSDYHSATHSIHLRPRFLMYGGWQTEFTFGYNVPTAPYLFVAGTTYTLNFTFMADWLVPAVVDHTEVQIVLPEGAKNVEVITPFSVEKSEGKMLTYVDTEQIGRPVLTLSKDNLITGVHNQHFQVKYIFETTNMFIEPLLLFGFFFALCVAIMIVSRINLSIYPKGSSLPTAVAAKVDAIFRERAALHQSFDEALAHFVTTTKTNRWLEAKKSIKQWNILAQQVKNLLSNVPHNLVPTLLKLEDLQASKVSTQQEHAELLLKSGTVVDKKTDKKLRHLEELYYELSAEIENHLEELNNPQ